MSIAVLLGSTRAGGNTEQLVDLVVDGVSHHKYVLSESHIETIIDQRHDPEGFQPVPDDYDRLIQKILEHDILIFATPVYWYGVSGTLKTFIDRWSQSLRSPDYNFKELISQKKAYIVVVGGDDPHIKALPLIQQLKYTFDFVNLPLEGYLIGKGSKPGDVLQDTRAVQNAKWLNTQLKELYS
ncbi:flavodoxin family protein [Paenibacillus sp. J22TS3]|uniref:flavodoxin family protein n=1 Tax=Paenibacillus sp. J22TS3 TaxID=2807192 RepID=UPI001B244969|nr:flavodoxin family protein [Paenibacillus sp. J22TS3]GIP23471.1 NAD(P)H-dependent oxidoreductase [Paenibacillus sp. J22TS3]